MEHMSGSLLLLWPAFIFPSIAIHTRTHARTWNPMSKMSPKLLSKIPSALVENTEHPQPRLKSKSIYL